MERWNVLPPEIDAIRAPKVYQKEEEILFIFQCISYRNSFCIAQCGFRQNLIRDTHLTWLHFATFVCIFLMVAWLLQVPWCHENNSLITVDPTCTYPVGYESYSDVKLYHQSTLWLAYKLQQHFYSEIPHWRWETLSEETRDIGVEGKILFKRGSRRTPNNDQWPGHPVDNNPSASGHSICRGVICESHLDRSISVKYGASADFVDYWCCCLLIADVTWQGCSLLLLLFLLMLLIADVVDWYHKIFWLCLFSL